MNYMNLMRIAIRALKRNKTRTFLTMLGILIGVASVIAMLAIGQGSKASIQTQLSSMGTNMIFVMPGSMFRGGVQMGPSNMQSLKMTDLEAIEKNCPDVTMVSPEVRTSGQSIYSNKNWPTTIYGVTPQYLDIRKITIETGRIFTEREVKNSAKVCLIGKTVKDNLFANNQDPVGTVIRFKNIPFKVIGVLAEKGQSGFGQDQDDLIVAPYTTVQKRILAITWLNAIYASAASEELGSKAQTEIEQTLREQHKIKAGEEDDFTVRSQTELVNTFSSVSNVLTALLGAIAGISLLVGGIGIMNIMFVSVTERTREIGLRMSVGARSRDIMMQFLVESVLISIIGGIIGIIFGMGASALISSVMGWPVMVMPQSVVLSFVVCTFIGVFFGWYPARKAAELDPIEAIRYE
ncbi:MAG: ABC transporter permease [Bacteroidales bacterium]